MFLMLHFLRLIVSMLRYSRCCPVEYAPDSFQRYDLNGQSHMEWNPLPEFLQFPFFLFQLLQWSRSRRQFYVHEGGERFLSRLNWPHSFVVVLHYLFMLRVRYYRTQKFKDISWRFNHNLHKHLLVEWYTFHSYSRYIYMDLLQEASKLFQILFPQYHQEQFNPL